MKNFTFYKDCLMVLMLSVIADTVLGNQKGWLSFNLDSTTVFLISSTLFIAVSFFEHSYYKNFFKRNLPSLLQSSKEKGV